MKLQNIIDEFDKILGTNVVADSSLNGLQVDSNNPEISKVAFAVDSGLSIIEKAVAAKCQLLVVHHGLFWNESQRVTGPLSKKLELLFKGGCSLYASHLPLDSHLEFGNGAELARFLGAESIQAFCQYKGVSVGVKAKFPNALSLEELKNRCSKIDGASHLTVLPFGKEEISTVGVVTGAGAFAMTDCIKENLDLLISGEPRHSAYHDAQEMKINAIFAGHYATETFGVKALQRHLHSVHKLDTLFINESSGI